MHKKALKILINLNNSLNTPWLYFISFFIVFSLFSCSKQPSVEKKITIAVAASAYDAILALAEAYTQETKQNVELIRGSSGKLATQIIQSAPYALFFSADEYYPTFLEKNKSSAGRSRIYAKGFLSVWVQNNTTTQTLIDLLKSTETKKIALANTSSAPYGKAAYQWMKEKNILKAIEHKLVFGESIAQVNTYIMSNTVDVAFTNLSSLTNVDQQIKNKIIRLPIEESPSLPQAMIITKYGQEHFPEESQSFFNFALSKRGQAVLQSFGYDNP